MNCFPLQVDIISFDYLLYVTNQKTDKLYIKKWITLTLQHVIEFERDVLNVKLNTCILISISLGTITQHWK